MYFSDAYPELSSEQRRSFAAAERRLVKRLVIVGCVSLAIMVFALV